MRVTLIRRVVLLATCWGHAQTGAVPGHAVGRVCFSVLSHLSGTSAVLIPVRVCDAPLAVM